MKKLLFLFLLLTSTLSNNYAQSTLPGLANYIQFMESNVVTDYVEIPIVFHIFHNYDGPDVIT